MRASFTIAGLVAGLAAGYEIPVWTDDWEENAINGFEFCDKDQGSTVTFKEFQRCWKEIAERDGEKKDAEADFVKYDLDGNGKLDFDEVKLVEKRTYGPQPTSISGEANFDTTFKWIDDDGSGTISWREFKSCWHALYKDWSYQDLLDVFRFADYDQDGAVTYNEALDEYEARSAFDRKFSLAEPWEKDGRIGMYEWSANPLFVSAGAKTSTIRERFGYYDENTDGWLDNAELYRTIRANQIRWKRFLTFWYTIDETGDGWTDTSEALPGLREVMDPDMSKAQADALIAMFDKNGDGRVHQIEWWMKESKDWDTKREKEIAKRVRQKEFSSGWYTYDANRDNLVEFAELRYARDWLESSDQTKLFCEHFRGGQPCDASTVMTYDEAFTTWSTDADKKADFHKKWLVADSDSDWKLTIADIYAVVGVIPELRESDVPELWNDIDTNGDGIAWYNEACEAVVNQYLCREDYDAIREYVYWKDGEYDDAVDVDKNGDGKIDDEELRQTLDHPSQADILKFMEFFDHDGDYAIGFDELFPNLYIFETRKKQAIEIWKKVDPKRRYVAYQYQLEEHASEAEWLPSDYFDGIDANGDGVVSAQEACLKTGVWVFECKHLPNFEWHEPNWDEKKLDFLAGWYRVDRDQDELANFSDIRAARSAEYTDEQVIQEFNFYSSGEEVASFYQVFEQWKEVAVRMMKFWHWFESLKTDENDDSVTGDELVNDTSGWIDLSDNQSGSVEYSSYDLCLMWFTDVPMACEQDNQSPLEDIAPESFIKSWYAFDRDQDEVAHMGEFLDWASTSEFYSWMSRADVKEHVWDPIDTDGSGSISFVKGLNNYNEVTGNFSKLDDMANLLGANETDRRFDFSQLENQMVTFKEEFETNNDNWDPEEAFQEWDTNGDGYVSIDKELCAVYVGKQYCGPPEYSESDGSGDSQYHFDHEYEQGVSYFYMKWYRVDQDQDEQASEADLRAARGSEITDEQVSSEFAHYDLNGDGIVTIDEAWQVGQQDEEDFDKWFEELALQDNDGWYLEKWEHDKDPKIDWNATDTDQDDRVTKDEACAQFFSAFPQICSDYNYIGPQIADYWFLWTWYGMDTDKDESVTLSDFIVWWQYLEYGKYSWMTGEEIQAAFFDVWDSDGDGLVSFNEAWIGYQADIDSDQPFYAIWEAINVSDYVNQETVVSAWQDSWITDLGIEQENPYTLFEWLDIDADGELDYGEVCAAVTGRRYRCHSHSWIDPRKIDWKYDFNLDRFVERAEYERALTSSYSSWKEWRSGPYWDEWLAIEASDPSKLSFAQIQTRVAVQADVKRTWQDALASINIEPKDSTTIGSDQALELFNMVIDDETDRDGDGRIQYSEYCMSKLHVEVACLTELEWDIQYYDSNNNGGVGWDEFLVIIEDEEDMMSSADYLDLFFNMYDVDNDGLLTVRDIWDLETMMNHTRAFNTTGWHWAAFELLDGNNDTYIEHGEFNTGMNVILTLTDLQTMDSSQSDTVYNQVFDSVSTTDSELEVTHQQHYALWAFMKDVIKRGLDSYMQDNNITE